MGRSGYVWQSALLMATVLLPGCSDPSPTFQYLGKESQLHGPPGDGYKPPTGMVSTPDAAARNAEAVADGIYGEAQIRQQRPFQVTDTPAHWIVRGNSPLSGKGGVFEIVINKQDGAVVHILHGE